MKKVETINLGGYKFVIDFDAYDTLDHYLDDIENHFNKSEGCEEIMEDIEMRMAELFQEKMESSTIINNKHVSQVIEVMGSPEDFGATSTDRKQYSNADQSIGNKRLFRDTEEKVIAGVCSGLSSYFAIKDPVIVRAIFTISFFAFGVGLIPYIILWIIMPEAKSAHDRLAMKGEAINIDSIAKEVEDEIMKLKIKIEGIGKKKS